MAKRIVQLKKLNQLKKEAIFGVVTDISDQESVLTIKNPIKKTTYLVEASSKTKISKKINQRIEFVKFEDIKKNDRIVALGLVGENGEKTIKAVRIHIIPAAK